MLHGPECLLRRALPSGRKTPVRAMSFVAAPAGSIGHGSIWRLCNHEKDTHLHKGLLSGRRALIVEDEFLIALDIQRLLEEGGASETLIATNLTEAGKLLAGGLPIDLAIVDLRLGNEDARPLIDELTSRGIPLVITSGLNPGEVEVSGSVAVMPKPHSDQEFALVLRSLLGVAQAR
jgi:CheY-like chemotaxis protein